MGDLYALNEARKPLPKAKHGIRNGIILFAIFTGGFFALNAASSKVTFAEQAEIQPVICNTTNTSQYESRISELEGMLALKEGTILDLTNTIATLEWEVMAQANNATHYMFEFNRAKSDVDLLMEGYHKVPGFIKIAERNLLENGWQNGQCYDCSSELTERLRKAGYNAFARKIKWDCSLEKYREPCQNGGGHFIVCIGADNDVCIECLTGVEIPPEKYKEFIWVS